MRGKKRSLILLIVSLLTLLAVSMISVTYAWFLSRYSENYDFLLKSESHVVLMYESTLAFPSGTTQNTSANQIKVAELKPAAIGIQTGAYSPMDVFDVDGVGHSGLMAASANAVHFTAQGGYWYGYGTESGELSFSLVAKPQNNSNYDLVHYGELDYVVIFDYCDYKILLFDGVYYTNSREVLTTGGDTMQLSGTSLVLPTTAATFGTDGTDPWWQIPMDGNHPITTEITTSTGTEVKEIFNNHLLLLPNTVFAFTLYVFAAKPDYLMDMAWNGQVIGLEATISVSHPTV